jgi:hypothetical protein
MGESYESILDAAQRLPAEQEVQAAAERLSAEIKDALASVTAQSPESVDSLDACADRLERAAHDLAVALRELAEVNQAAAGTSAGRGIARRHFGAWDSSDERSADNERIDLDLAREYGGSHQP